jgi:hypothetical protein
MQAITSPQLARVCSVSQKRSVLVTFHRTCNFRSHEYSAHIPQLARVCSAGQKRGVLVTFIGLVTLEDTSTLPTAQRCILAPDNSLG